MVDEDIKTQHLEAHVVHVVFRLRASVALLQYRLHRTERFDYDLLDFFHDFVHISPHLLEQFEDARETSFMAHIHVVNLLVEANHDVIIIYTQSWDYPY